MAMLHFWFSLANIQDQLKKSGRHINQDTIFESLYDVANDEEVKQYLINKAIDRILAGEYEDD